MPRKFSVPAWVMGLFLVLCLPLLARAQKSACVQTPISIPVTNVTVAGGSPNAIARGVAISVGNPPQALAFMPSPYNNTLVLENTNLCSVPSSDGMSDASCITWSGGAYNPLKSTTKQGDSAAYAPDLEKPKTKLLEDVITLNSGSQVANYTFGVPLADWGEQYYGREHELGLGRNSTLLSALKSKGQIASRSWSFYWGRTGRDQQSNGALVLGGYDQSLVQGQASANYTQKLDYTKDCIWGTSIPISSMDLISQGDDYTNIYNTTSGSSSSSPLYACIDPGFVGVGVFPSTVFGEFARATNYSSFLRGSGMGIRSFGYNFYCLEYPAGDDYFRGDMEITVSGGPKIRITNKELVVPHQYMDDTTSTWQQNTTFRDLRLNPDTAIPSDRMRFGRNALSSMYLMVNYDAGTFTLWPAFTDATTQNFQAVGESNELLESTPTCASAPGTSSTNPASTSSTAPASPSEEKKTPIGAIVGGVIGGLIVVIALLLGVLFCLRRKRNKKEANGAPVWIPSEDKTTIHEAGPGTTQSYYAPPKQTTNMHELPNQTTERRFHEMPGS